jgi:hypothetical protein
MATGQTGDRFTIGDSKANVSSDTIPVTSWTSHRLSGDAPFAERWSRTAQAPRARSRYFTN